MCVVLIRLCERVCCASQTNNAAHLAQIKRENEREMLL